MLYSFTGGADGNTPFAGVIRDSAGNLYGTTIQGGTSGAGVVYKVDSAGHETVLHSFTGGADGVFPYFNGVTRDPAGNLYGATYSGGTSNAGVVYELDAAGTETVLYSFTGGADGGNPRAGGVIRDPAGNLYGTTFQGGTANAGVVYKLDTTGRETVLYSFAGAADGANPTSLIRDSAGSLYGITGRGGTASAGVIYKVDTTGHQTVLYTFTGGADGGHPTGVMRDSAGNLYGTANQGGTANAGVVYKLDTGAQETVLYSFTGGADGGDPDGGVIEDSEGNLYGTTLVDGTANGGVVYKLDAAGQETVVYSFPGTVDGSGPYAPVIRDSAGNLLGTDEYGGAVGWGVVYKVAPNGHETVLYTFTGGVDGGYPYSGVIEDSTGNLYGTTNSGGAAGLGVVYKLEAAGHESVLYSFTGGPTEATPRRV